MITMLGKGIKKNLLFILWLLLCGKGVLGQQFSYTPEERILIVDSLLLVLKNTSLDSIKVKVLNGLASNKYMIARQNGGNDFEPALKLANEALLLAQKLNDKQEQENAISTLAGILRVQGNLPESLKRHFIALKLSEEIGNKQEVANEHLAIGVIYSELGNLSEALKNQLISLKIKEEIGWKDALPLSYNAIGNTYYDKGNIDEAMKYFILGLKISKKQDAGQVGAGYKGLGKVYMAKGDYTEALKYFFNALKMLELGGAKFYLSECYLGIGDVYLKKATSEKIQLSKGNYIKALRYFDTGLLLAKRTSYKKSIINAYSGLAEAYTGIGDYKKALRYTLLKSQLKDSLFNNSSYTKMAELKMQYEAENKAVIEKAKQEKGRADKKSKNNLLILGGSAIILIFIFVGLLLRQRNLKKRANEKVETIHKMAELEMQSLRSQLNPHFIFNSLNSIQTLILKEETDKSQSYLSRFGRLLRMLLENADKPFIPLRKEIDFLQLYLGLESLRVPDMQYSFSTDPALNTDQILIPNMFLQPYVENAIWHGLSHKEINKQLQIRIYRENGIMNYEIEDNGVGRKKAEELKSLFHKQRQSKGMELLSKRIKLLNSEYSSTIQTEITDVIKNSEVAGTLVTIKIPVTLSESLLN